MINKGKLFKFFSLLFLFLGIFVSIFVISSNKIEARATEVSVSNLGDLQNALSEANENTIITVTSTIEITGDTNLDGNGATVTVPKPFINEDGTLNASIEWGEVCNPTCSTYGVFKITGGEVTISNMTIMGGYEENPEYHMDEKRGAIYITSGFLKLTDVTLTRSYRGISCYSEEDEEEKKPRIEMHNCNVVRNAALFGGGIFSKGRLLMDGCSLSENRSLRDGGGGGAIEINGASFYANNTVIVNNFSTESGGAINGIGNVYLVNCTVTGNSSKSTSGGGGIAASSPYISNSLVFIFINSIITDNYRENPANTEKPFDGEDIYVCNQSASVSLYNCIYGKIGVCENGTYTLSDDCSQDINCQTALSYRESGILNNLSGYTKEYKHPATISKTSGKPELYVPTNGNYDKVTEGGIKTYLNYSNFKTDGSVGIGYGDTSNITTLIGSVSESNHVTSYYESEEGTRDEGVIGASGPIDGNFYTVTLAANSNGIVSGATIYGDSYPSGTSVTVTATPNDISNHLYKWILKAGDTVVAVSSANPYTFTVTQNLTLSLEYTDAIPIVVTATDQAIDYNAEAPSYAYTVKINDTTVTDEALLSQISTKFSTELGSLTSAYTKGDAVGSYTISVASKNTTYMEKFTYDAKEYFISFVQGTLTVNKATPIVTAPTAKTLTYTGEAQALVNAGTTTGGELQYKLNNGEYSTTIPTGTDAGTYTVYYKVVGGENYSDVAEAHVDVTIAKAQVTAPTANNTAYVYTGVEQTYTLIENSLYTITNNTRTAAGEQTVTVALNDKTNYEWEDSKTTDLEFTFTIAKAQVTAPTANNTAYIYTGVEQTYTLIENSLYTITNNTRTNVGEQTVTVALNDKDNYCWTDSTTDNLEFTFTIAKAQVTAPTANNTAYIYTGVEQTYTLIENSLYTITNNTRTNVGEQTVTVALNDKDNYCWTDSTTDNLEFTFTIAKATPIVTAPTAKELTYTGEAQALVNAGSTTGGELQYSLDNTTYSTTIPTGIDAGTYTVYYKVVGNDNYSDIVAANVDVTIAKAALMVTAENKNIIYGSAAPTYTAITTGFVNDETLSVLTGALAFACEYTQNSNVGTYDITPSGYASDNYEITFTAGTLTVAKETATLTAPTAKTLTYTGEVQALVNAGTTTGGELQYSLDNTTYAATIPTGTNAGAYKVYYKVVGGTNYTDVEAAYVDVTIAKAQVTAPTANNTAYIYTGVEQTYTLIENSVYTIANNTRTAAGEQTVTVALNDKTNYEWADSTTTDLEFTFTIAKAQVTAPTANNTAYVYTGVGQTYTLIENSLYTITNNTRTDAGEQTVTVALNDKDNYCWTDSTTNNLEFTFTISQKVVEITWTNATYTYNGSEQTVRATYKNVANEDVALAVTMSSTFKNAGSYTATAAFANNETNYELPIVVTNSYSIAKATPSYTVPTDLQAITNNKLSDVTLPEGFTWNDSTLSVGSTATTKTFKAKYTPTDTDNYLVVENIDINITVTIEWNVADPEVESVSAKINGVDTVDASIKLKVEVKAEMSGAEESSDTSVVEKEAVKEKLSKDDKVAIIYDVKLLRKTTINGVETTVEIQPSEIKPGVSIEIEMTIPEELAGENFRILHIHNDESVEEVSYSFDPETRKISVLTDKLSEFAFIINTGTGSGINVGLIVLIVILIVLATLIILASVLFLLKKKYIVSNGKPVMAMVIGTKDENVRLMRIYFKVDYRKPSEIYDSKEKALASIKANDEEPKEIENKEE